MDMPKRMKFGSFLGPFHRVGENPTLAIDRDLELIDWMDSLGFDEVWIGEHHSAGWEIISSPEVFIAAAAQRTRYIKLGTGVVSLPYHHPLMVANRIVQLDHMSRGRVLFGVGPGALPGDAYMLGIDPTKQRQRMDEALGVILRLMTETEPITYKSDWFELQEAMLQLRPFTKPTMHISVASVQSPAGVALAGKYGTSVLTITRPRDPGAPESDLAGLWAVAEESAAEHNQVVNRDDWRLVLPVHVAETRKEAFEQARIGAGRYQAEYFEHTMGRDPVIDGPPEKIIDAMVDNGTWIIGDPDDCIASIRKLEERSGGFGGFMVQTIDWAQREQVMHSFELLARYVMPVFQGTTLSTAASNQWAFEHRDVLTAGRVRAIDRAKSDYATR